jgi:archaeosortase B (VPXXXP-CTERM-specific)
MLIFSAAVLAFPTSWKKKAVGLLLGNPAIYLFNVVRIAMLIVVGRYWPGAFDFMHLYFWQATMIVMIVSVWLLWIIKVVRTDEAPLPATA